MIRRVSSKYPNFVGAVIALNVAGEVGAACAGIGEFVGAREAGEVGAACVVIGEFVC